MRNVFRLIGLCALAAGAGFPSFNMSGAEWWLKAGPVFRGGMEVKFGGSSYAQTLGLDGIGAANAYADRAYDNGYVKQAPSTGNPAAIDPNTTWNWGYNANSVAGQYDAGAGTLSFQRQGIPRYSALSGGGVGGREDLLAAGLQLSVGIPVKQTTTWSLDLVFGFQSVWSFQGKYRERARYFTATDSYNVAGINSTAFANLNHHGTPNGPFDAAATPPYTIIPNLPASRTLTPFAAAAGAQSSIAFDMSQSVYQLSFGPQIGLASASRLKLHLAPTISVSIMDVNVDRSETFMFGDGTGARRWSDSASRTRAAFGWGATAGGDLDLGKGWSLTVFSGYEWLSKKATLAVGPNTVSVNGNGWVAGLAMGKSF